MRAPLHMQSLALWKPIRTSSNTSLHPYQLPSDPASSCPAHHAPRHTECRYVDVIGDNWKRAVLYDYTDPLDPVTVKKSPSDVHIWGHWVHVLAPHMMREKVEEWMATAPL